MIPLRTPAARGTLLLLLTGMLATASLIPFMGVYIVQELGQEPLMISVYAVTTLTLTLLVNRNFGERIDRGDRIAPLLMTSMGAFSIGLCVMLMTRNFWVLPIVCSPLFALANGAVSTMYSFGRLSAERYGWDIAQFNSYLRATASLAWMIAPAFAFSVAGGLGNRAVPVVALVMAGVWALLFWRVMPMDFAKALDPVDDTGAAIAKPDPLPAIWLAAAVCLLFALAHSATSMALPLFFLEEVGLPKFAPGLAFSVKTGVEIVAILSTPMLMRVFGIRRCLMMAGAVALLAFVTLAQTRGLPGLVIGAALEGLYYGTFAAVGLLFVQGFANGRMGRATSLYMNSLFLGGLIASPMMGAIAQFLSFQAVIYSSIVWALGALALLFAMRSHKIAAVEG
ncbi:MFS transporter [Sulfitobacter sp. S190]|uniref:MFS transporter n=1 Tax=Sulfitobacter sp. S190 TaxID=2867022 RepID=UPI0021A96914|nr:MFS transporter [Sulfitobacter sp. S190]UWR22073.1 MFS transporter [Sulfitobacter sp. S190]